MALQGFDKEYYLGQKLAALQATESEWVGETTDSLETVLGNVYGLTAEEHYMQYGWQEGLAPNQYFNVEEYKLAKAQQLVDSGNYLTVESAMAAFEDAWQQDPYQHYIQYGAGEGINPSNDFDASQYFVDKLAALQAADPDTYGDWTTTDVQNAFQDAGLTAIGHFMLYGKDEGLTVTAVPAGEQVNPGESPPTGGETFTLTADASSVDEGDIATFTLTTTNVAVGTALAYTLSGTGIDAADIVDGVLTGEAIVGADGNAVIEVDIAADTTTEGLETLSVALDNGEATATADINDTSLDPSTPTYTLTPAAPSVDEGATATFTLATTNVDEGTALAYTLSGTGIDAADIVDGVLTGVATVGADGTAAIDVALAADGTPEGEETLTLALDGQDASAAVIVNDTSTEAPAVNVIASTQADETLEGTAGVDNFVYDYAGANMTDTEGAITTGAGAGLDGDDNVISFVAGTDKLTFNDPTGTIATKEGFESAGVELGYNFDGDVSFKFTDSNSNELNLFIVKGLLDINNQDHVDLVADDMLTIDEVITVIGVDNIDFTDVGA
ncbi:MAG: hypothetical protein AB7F20_06405 [Geoalkalibacter sp.]|uniref:hypothetical protein n=1 Tax=Geoalkalibacter sp. TaxID=3041440 RepID=UPI003D144228